MATPACDVSPKGGASPVAMVVTPREGGEECQRHTDAHVGALSPCVAIWKG